MSSWTRSSWREKPIRQQPTYSNQEVLKNVELELSKYPPLVFAGAVCKQILEKKGVYIGAHIKSIKDVFGRYQGVKIGT